MGVGVSAITTGVGLGGMAVAVSASNMGVGLGGMEVGVSSAIWTVGVGGTGVAVDATPEAGNPQLDKSRAGTIKAMIKIEYLVRKNGCLADMAHSSFRTLHTPTGLIWY
jgi:hypothetical protein